MAARLCKQKIDTERNPVSDLTDDLLVEIISRLPFKSTCCCKCVSTRWRDVVAHHDHAKKLPQTLAGFFYQNDKTDRCPYTHPAYQSISGNGYWYHTSLLPFLEECQTMRLFLTDCCNGLLLFRHLRHTDSKLVYLVCNPATGKFVAVPPSNWSERGHRFARLAFDPAVSSHFHVFEFADALAVDAKAKGRHAGGLTKGVTVYSSKAGAWTHRIVWDNLVPIWYFSRGVYLSGLLYLSSSRDSCVALVGMEGDCRVIHVPAPYSARDIHSVYLSQGQLHLVNNGASELSIWTLQDASTETWILKHNVSHSQLLGTEYSMFAGHYTVISIHPESNAIFILCGKGYPLSTKLMSYQIDSRKLRFICDIPGGCMNPYLSYVPLFSESLGDGN